MTLPKRRPARWNVNIMLRHSAANTSCCGWWLPCLWGTAGRSCDLLLVHRQLATFLLVRLDCQWRCILGWVRTGLLNSGYSVRQSRPRRLCASGSPVAPSLPMRGGRQWTIWHRGSPQASIETLRSESSASTSGHARALASARATRSPDATGHMVAMFESPEWKLTSTAPQKATEPQNIGTPNRCVRSLYTSVFAKFGVEQQLLSANR